MQEILNSLDKNVLVHIILISIDVLMYLIPIIFAFIFYIVKWGYTKSSLLKICEENKTDYKKMRKDIDSIQNLISEGKPQWNF